MEISNLFNVKDKVVLVTGGSRGIGLMIAHAFVSNGARVYITSRNIKICNQEANRLNALGPGKCFSIPADLQKIDQLKFLVGELNKHEKQLNILINNAGVNWGETIEEYPESAFDV